MKRGLMILSVLLLLAPRGTQAQWAVIDVDSIAQLLLQYKTQLMQYTEELRQTAYQYQTVVQQIEHIKYTYETVQQGVANLTKLNLNNATSLMGLYSLLNNKLNQASMIG